MLLDIMLRDRLFLHVVSIIRPVVFQMLASIRLFI